MGELQKQIAICAGELRRKREEKLGVVGIGDNAQLFVFFAADEFEKEIDALKNARLQKIENRSRRRGDPQCFEFEEVPGAADINSETVVAAAPQRGFKPRKNRGIAGQNHLGFCEAPIVRPVRGEKLDRFRVRLAEGDVLERTPRGVADEVNDIWVAGEKRTQKGRGQFAAARLSPHPQPAGVSETEGFLRLLPDLLPEFPNPETLLTLRDVVKEDDSARPHLGDPTPEIVFDRLVGMEAVDMKKINAPVVEAVREVVEESAQQRGEFGETAPVVCRDEVVDGVGIKSGLLFPSP